MTTKDAAAFGGARLRFTGGSSDKTYIVEMFRGEEGNFITGDGTWTKKPLFRYTVVSWWGRTSAPRSQSQVKYQGTSFSAALRMAEGLILEKVSKGYRLLETYGSLSPICPHLHDVERKAVEVEVNTAADLPGFMSKALSAAGVKVTPAIKKALTTGGWLLAGVAGGPIQTKPAPKPTVPKSPPTVQAGCDPDEPPKPPLPRRKLRL